MRRAVVGIRICAQPKSLRRASVIPVSPHIQRGVGEVDPQTGKKIVSKELGHIGVSEDGKYIIPGLTVKYDDGSTSQDYKPMTQHGSSDLRDNQLAHIPIERVMDEVRGYGQMVGQLNQPDRTAFLNNMVNPPDKTASREEAKGLRRDLLDVGKARAKALAGATDKEAMAEINSQYDQLQNQVLQTYGQPGKAADTFEDFAVEYQKENGVPPDPKNEQDSQFYQQWKSQRQGGTPPVALATANPQGQAPSQLPDNSYAAGYLREMRQQSQRQQQ